MLRVAIRFLAGRFHATPWDHHVNEGVPEWPPSPWRLQRALISVLRQRGAEIDVPRAERAILALSQPPSFHLPPASAAHTRHYLSLNQLERTKTTLTLDTFVTVDCGAPVIVSWDLELEPGSLEVLSLLLSRVTYLGRAESWCEARVLPGDEEAPEPNCVPSDGTAAVGVETVRTLCAASSAGIEDLERTTTVLQDEGWSEPPGSRWVFYRRRAGLLGSGFRNAVPRLSRPPVSVAEFTVAGLLQSEDEGTGRPEVSPVCPRVTKAILLTSRLRDAALSRHEVPSSVLSGRGEDGTPLTNQHRHAHYLFDSRAEGDSRRRGKVTHLYVWVPGSGLGEKEQEALERIRRLIYFDGAERQQLRVVPSGFGDVEDFGAVSRIFGESRVWESVSPVVLPRHPKRNGRDRAEDQVRRELAFRGFPKPVRVDVLDDRKVACEGLEIPCADFETRRKGTRPQTGKLGFRIEFAELARGPISLGLGGHFGVGLFGAVA
ncbi:MAG: type I-U CRISPR-associated protein Cas5/Cas6 [Acidobacteria bacterium]|nr:type I-U CRISPR-associated protein Cas5/Cas6 [Acidobacteriota bacterium]